MHTEQLIRILAGTFVLTGVSLAFFTDQIVWLALPAFVGVNLVQSAVTGFCPAEKIFRALGVKSCCAET